MTEVATEAATPALWSPAEFPLLERLVELDALSVFDS